MRRLLVALTVLTVVAAGAAATTSRGARADLHAQLSRALAAPGISPSRTAALAVDLRTGETVFDRNGDVPLAPASTEKLAVSFAALRLLGPAYRFRTDVVGLGALDGHTWDGSLFLVGHGDPTLALSDIGALARSIKTRGIRRVTGRVLGDERYFDARRDAPGWKPSFLGIESRPLSALSVAGTTEPGVNGASKAAARALTKALERRGIAVVGRPGAGGAPSASVPLAHDVSHPLEVVVRTMNHHSDNFYAEVILKDLGAAFAGRGTTSAGAEIVAEALAAAGVPLAGVRIADGSGLSLEDRQTSRSLVGILRAGVADPATRQAFVGSLSVAGVSGTLADRLGGRPTRGRVVAKTGTTNASCALAGFVGRRYVFAILQNGSPVPYWTARVAQDRFVSVLAGA